MAEKTRLKHFQVREMSSTQGPDSSVSGLGCDKVKQTDKRSKRHMSPHEEAVLLASLKELIAGGYKSDNGFRGGYLGKLEELMKNKFPNTDLKGIPHIHSKIQTWKKWYNSLTTMLSRSGIGFKDNMIDCSEELWDEIVKCDANAKAMRRKSWPMFEDWKEIFGKDRATGDHAEDVLDAVNDLMNQANMQQEENPTEYHVGLEETGDTDAWEHSVCGGEGIGGKNTMCGAEDDEAVNKRSGKKRKSSHAAESTVGVLLEMNRATNERLDALASRIGYEYDLDEARKESFSLLEPIPDLSLEEKFEICDIFADKPERLPVFKGLPEYARPHYVRHVLKSRSK